MVSNITDDLDRMLQGEDTPYASQAQTEGQQLDSTQVRPIEQQTEEEIEFNRLSGSTQDRIRELFKRAREAENKLGSVQQTYIPPAPNTVTADQRQALETLSQFGVATDDKVDAKVNGAVNQIKQELKFQNLEQKYSGRNGEPKFDREEVEDYMKSHPQYQYYDPEDVFKYKMFPDELSETQTQTAKPRTSSLKPTKAQTRQDALTPEFIEERLKQADGDEWYEANKDEINKVVYNHTQQFKGTNFGGQ